MSLWNHWTSDTDRPDWPTCSWGLCCSWVVNRADVLTAWTFIICRCRLLTVEQIKSLSSLSLLTVMFSKHCSGSALFKVFVGISVYCQWLCMCLYGTAGVVSEWDLWYDSVLLRRRAWPGLPAVDLSLPSRWVSHPCCLLTCQLVLGGRISWVSL